MYSLFYKHICFNETSLKSCDYFSQILINEILKNLNFDALT